MEEPGGGKGPQQVGGHPHVGLGHHVEYGIGKEEVDALHVVEVGAPHSLNVLVGRGHLGTLVHLGILGIGKHLVYRHRDGEKITIKDVSPIVDSTCPVLVPLPGGERGHDEHLEDQEGPVKDEVAQQLLVHGHLGTTKHFGQSECTGRSLQMMLLLRQEKCNGVAASEHRKGEEEDWVGLG